MTNSHAAQPKMGTASNGHPMHYSVGAIIEDGARGEFLMLNRQFAPLGYACMAGHVDEGETALEAVHREGLEELGTELTDVELLYEGEVLWSKCWKADVHYWYLYRARVNRAKVQVDPHEAKDWGWFSREQLKLMSTILAKKKLEPIWCHWFKEFKII